MRVLGKDYEGQDCAVARALESVGERWTMLIVRDAFFGVRRFNDFQAHLDIPRAVLSGRLNGLVDDGILERVPDPEHAGRQVYELTEAGHDLWPVVHALLVWGRRHRNAGIRVYLHAVCETELEDSGACPKCGMTPEPEDVVSAPITRSSRDDPVAVALRSPHRLLEPLPT